MVGHAPLESRASLEANYGDRGFAGYKAGASATSSSTWLTRCMLVPDFSEMPGSTAMMLWR